ncbi:MAG: nitroreductase family deazaflavin-dependent oxidoreductase [Acidimicrobiia bacterium]
MNTLWTIILALSGLVAAIGALFMAGIRYKWPVVLNGVRRINRRFMNPRQMRSAGTPGAYAGIIHHVGRRSGREYQTPVGIVPADGGVAIVLPYGTRPDWVKNVMAAGKAEITHEGRRFPVTDPQVVPVESSGAAFTTADRRTQRLYGVDRCLRLRTAAVSAQQH